jgi:hypothetical protein
MENEFDINNLTGDDFMQMATYVAHLERDNQKLLGELQQTKSYLAATLQQRNSAENKLRTLLMEKQNTINIREIKEVPLANIELINPEQYREKPNQR